MKKMVIIVLVALVFLPLEMAKAVTLLDDNFQNTSHIVEENWPQLENGKDNIFCSQAFKIADSIYNSNSFYLYELANIPSGVNSKLVLQPNTQHGVDLSSGDALTADQSVFQKIPQNKGGAPRSIYWQKNPINNSRFVMYEDTFGWRGDQYTLFSIKDDITPNQFLNGSDRNQKRMFTPLIEEGWRPPLILQEKNTGDIWAISVGAPYIFLSDWNIYSVGYDGAKQRCTVHFHPKNKTAITLLPIEIQKLAKLLDGVLGSGKNEGTSNPTARVRTEIIYTWANVAMRPWALTNRQPLNSRHQVDNELIKWSKKAVSFEKLYKDILLQYPKAEMSLAQYYKEQFNKTEDETTALAKQALDIAFRSYFMF